MHLIFLINDRWMIFNKNNMIIYKTLKKLINQQYLIKASYEGAFTVQLLMMIKSASSNSVTILQPLL